MAVVTISGQFGSGAREVGRLIAQRLSMDYVDQEILVEAARALGVPVESVVSHDERTASLGERLATMFRHFLERSAATSAGDPMLGSGGLDVLLGRTYAEAASESQEVSDDLYISTVNGIIRDVAAQDGVVIIGRGSQVILRDWPGAVHVLIVAPLEHRVRDMARKEGVSEEEAAKLVHDGDKGRAAFHRKFFEVEVDDPSLYHLTLNVGRLPVEEAARIVGDVAQGAAGGG